MMSNGDGSYLFCVDCRQLTERTRKNSHLLHRIDVILDALVGPHGFLLLILRSGDHQVEMDHCDSDKTTFVTRWGTIKFNGMPIDLYNA